MGDESSIKTQCTPAATFFHSLGQHETAWRCLDVHTHITTRHATVRIGPIISILAVVEVLVTRVAAIDHVTLVAIVPHMPLMRVGVCPVATITSAPPRRTFGGALELFHEWCGGRALGHVVR